MIDRSAPVFKVCMRVCARMYVACRSNEESRSVEFLITLHFTRFPFSNFSYNVEIFHNNLHLHFLRKNLSSLVKFSAGFLAGLFTL